ncbi:MAG: CoB--CoM heterodisulfide reductase iron-sulfur subunit B family protein [Thermodesulfobacteriota bacterium]
MKFAFFSGCKIPYFCPQYGASSKAVLHALNAGTVDIAFNCCGYPVRHFDFKAFLLQSARNFAMAEQKGVDIVTPCKCCFGSLKHAQHFMAHHPSMKNEINELLSREGRFYHGNLGIRHLLTVLMEDIGLETIRAKIRRRYHGLFIAPHYGCHALRPSEVTGFDNPFSPTIFEQLIQVTGAQTVEWSKKLECCGQPVAEKDEALSRRLVEKKIESADTAGADFVCSACTYCQMQFDAAAQNDPTANGRYVPSILYPQLLGLSMGLSDAALGLDASRVDGQTLGKYLAA